MKPLLALFALSLAFLSAQVALGSEPADGCAKQLAQLTLTQAKIDFPGQDLVTLPINMNGWDGGFVTSVDVSVAQASDTSDVVGVYRMMIDEVCSIINGGPTLEH